MTTLRPRNVFTKNDNDDGTEEYDAEKGGETESLLASSSSSTTTTTPTTSTSEGMTQRKITIRTISTKDLDLDLDPSSSSSSSNTHQHHQQQQQHLSQNEDDYYEEVVFEDELHTKSTLHRRPLFSFQISLSHSTYTISIPHPLTLLSKLLPSSSSSTMSTMLDTIDTAPFMRVGWIVLTLYVMTESLRRFDDQTGAFSGTTALERAHLMDHPVTTSTMTMPTNLPPGMTVSQPQSSSLLNPNLNGQALPQAPPPAIMTSSSTSTTTSTYGINQTPFASLPPPLDENLSDLTVPFSTTETPLYWHIPRSGGTMVKTIFGTCLGKVMASELGILDGHDQDKTLEIIARERPSGKFVNVDVSTLPGIQRAKELGLGSSGMAEIMASSHFQEMTTLFDPPLPTHSTTPTTTTRHHGRWFGLFRHPIDRAVSVFYFLKPLQAWGPEYAEMTLDQYVQSPFVESNWMIRYLIGKKAGDIGGPELDMAKEILRKKMLVGIMDNDRMEDSMDRFRQFFGWKVETEDQRQCTNRLLHEMKVGKNPMHESVLPGSAVWENLMVVNQWDMKLYDYVTMLFDEQQSLFIQE